MIKNTGASIDQTLCGSWTITGGKLIMFSGCVIQGTIETSRSPLYVEHGEIFEGKLMLGVAEE